MKKLIVIVLTLTLVSTLVMGCSPNKKPTSSPQSSSTPAEQPSQSVPVSKAEEPPVNSDVQEPKAEEATGIYNGKVDTNFVEIKLDSNSTPTEFSIAEISDNLKGYNKNDKVKIKFIVSEDKQYILKSIEKIK